MANITLEKLLNNNLSRILISIPEVQVQVPLKAKQRQTVKAFVGHDFAIGGGANFNNPLENQALTNLQQKIQAAQSIGLEALSQGSSVLGSLESKIKDMASGSNFSVGNVTQTLEFWSSSEKPQFSINILFVALKETDDVRKLVAPLYDTVYPQFGKLGFARTTSAPLGYRPFAGGSNALGTIDVQIGTWFTATQQIMKRVDFTFSKETIASGNPLYAYGTISFQPYRMISAEELRKYIGQ